MIIEEVADSTGVLVDISDNVFVGGETFVTINSGDVFNISNCTFSGSTTPAIIVAGGTLNLTNCEMFDCQNAEGNGGAILVQSGKLNIKDTEIQNCSAVNGGAIFMSSGVLSVQNVTATSNDATGSGGVICLAGGSATIKNATFSENHAGTNGGVVSIEDNVRATVSTEGCTMTNNVAVNKGGSFYVGKYAELNLKNSTISGNGSTLQARVGGGLYSYAGTTRLQGGVKFVNNHATGGGGISLDTSAKLYSNGATASNRNELIQNAADRGGGLAVDTKSAIIDLSHFTIKDNFATINGGGCYFALAWNVSYSDVIIENNTADCGGGMFFLNVSHDEHYISGVTIQNNKAYSYGGGICSENSYVSFVGTTISSNQATNGGGVYTDGSTFAIDSSEIESNTATYTGGGVYASYGTLLIENSTIESNKVRASSSTSRCGGGIYIYCVSTADIFGSSITSNSIETTSGTIVGTGGGIYSYSTKLVVDKCNVDSNKATSGGGLYCNQKTLEISGASVIEENTATSNGGGLYLAGVSDVKIDDSSISENSAGTTGLGGGIYSSYSNINLDGGEIIGNQANNGGGIYSIGYKLTIGSSEEYTSRIDSNVATSTGGGIYTSKVELCISEGTIYANKAIYGGGIYSNEGTLSIIDESMIENNIATLSGGGIYLDALVDVVISESQILANKINLESNQTSGLGGGIYSIDTPITLLDVDISSNQATHGGGVRISGGKLIVGGDSKFNENIASNVGGGIYISTVTEVEITGAEISLNESTGDGTEVGRGAGIFATGDEVVLNLSAVTVDSNKAGCGAGLYVDTKELIIKDNSSICNNISSSSGGGIYTNSKTIISNSLISSNNATTDGAGIYANSGTVSVDSGIISSNIATAKGGAIYSKMSITLTNSVIVGNKATNGGGIFVCYNSILDMNGGQITGNEATQAGGGIYLDSSTFNLYDGIVGGEYSDIAQNKSYVGNVATIKGGGVYLAESTLNVTQKDTSVPATGEISYNTSNNGAGAYAYYSTLNLKGGAKFAHNVASSTGGALCLDTGSALNANGNDISKVELLSNKAKFGGAIGVSTKHPEFSLSNVLIKGNEATHKGGGLYLNRSGNSESDPIYFSGAEFSSNTSGEGGGAIYTISSYVTFSNLYIHENSSTGSGGGLFASGGYMRFVGNNDKANNTLKISKNTTKYYGGGIYFEEEAKIVVDGPSIFENIAGYDGGGIGTNYQMFCDFTMNSGYVFENFAQDEGGGISIRYSHVYLNGGEISDNIGSVNGGGAYLGYCRVRIDGVKIINNSIIEPENKNTTMRGGGLVIYYGYNKSTDPEDGTIMTSGEISGNRIVNRNDEYSDFRSELAAGIYVSGTMTVDLRGGTIENNYFEWVVNALGANIYVNDNSTLLLNGATISHDANMSAKYDGYEDAIWGNGIYNIGKTIINSGTIASHAERGGAIFNANPFVVDSTNENGLTINGGTISNTMGTAIYSVTEMSIDGGVSCTGSIAIGSNTLEEFDYDDEDGVPYRTGFVNIIGSAHSSPFIIQVFDYEYNYDTEGYDEIAETDMILLHYLSGYFISTDETEYYGYCQAIVRGENVDIEKLYSFEGYGFYETADGMGYGLTTNNPSPPPPPPSSYEIFIDTTFNSTGYEYVESIYTSIIVDGESIFVNGDTVTQTEADGFEREFMYWVLVSGILTTSSGEIIDASDYGEYELGDGTYVAGSDIVLSVYTQDYQTYFNVTISGTDNDGTYDMFVYARQYEVLVYGEDIIINGEVFTADYFEHIHSFTEWILESGKLYDADGNVVYSVVTYPLGLDNGVYYADGDISISVKLDKHDVLDWQTLQIEFEDGDGFPSAIVELEGFAFEIRVQNDDGYLKVEVQYVVAFDEDNQEYIVEMYSRTWEHFDCYGVYEYYPEDPYGDGYYKITNQYFYTVYSGVVRVRIDDPFVWDSTDKTKIVGYVGRSVTVNIPTKATTIAYGAFKNKSSIQCLNIPQNVQTIEERAFENCYNLTSITFEDSSNPSLNLENNAFYNCLSIYEITAGSMIESPLSKSQFYGISELNKLVVRCENIATLAFQGSTIKNLVIESENVADYAFKSTTIQKLTLGGNISSIGKQAFWMCGILYDLDIPSTVTSIGDGAFAKNDFVEVDMSSVQITSIPNEVFADCYSLVSITIPTSVKTIEGLAFSNCTELETIIQESGTQNILDVNEIQYRGFYNCSSLEHITIKPTVMSNGIVQSAPLELKKQAFGNCENLKTITFAVKSLTINASTKEDSPFYGCTDKLLLSATNNDTNQPKYLNGEYWNYCSESYSTVIIDPTKEYTFKASCVEFDWNVNATASLWGSLSGVPVLEIYTTNISPVNDGILVHYSAPSVGGTLAVEYITSETGYRLKLKNGTVLYTYTFKDSDFSGTSHHNDFILDGRCFDQANETFEIMFEFF